MYWAQDGMIATNKYRMECRMAAKTDEIGKTYNRLTVLKEVEKHVYPSGDTRRKFLAQCSCGSEPKAYLINDLRSGHTKSCGCANIDNLTKHGMHDTRAYQCWSDMKTRCDNTKNKYYDYYGGRGITYDQKWGTFEGFWEDMKDTYSDKLTLNRRDNDGNYSKENCEWDTWHFQGHMRRKKQGTKLESIGMTYCDATGNYQARIKINEDGVVIGTYPTEQLAAKAYDDASEIVYGDRPNKTLKSEDATYNKVLWYLKHKDVDIRKIKSPSAKLNEQEVLEIVDLYRTSNYDQKEIAEMFGITQSTVSSICRGASWSRVTGIKNP